VGVGDRDGEGDVGGLGDGEGGPGALAEIAQVGGLVADGDRLPAALAVPVQGVELEVAAVGGAEGELELYLVGVVVAGSSSFDRFTRGCLTTRQSGRTATGSCERLPRRLTPRSHQSGRDDPLLLLWGFPLSRAEPTGLP
jgi:hypothetical protein